MKLIIYIILSLFTGILIYSCSNDIEKQVSDRSNLNEVGEKFMNYLEVSPDGQSVWAIVQKLGTMEPNLSYMAFGAGLGQHYVLPVTANGKLKAIVIYPFDESGNYLKNPTVVDGNNIDENFAARGVLRSPVRGDWENAGIEIGEDILPEKTFESTFMLSRSEHLGQYATFYWITCANYIDKWGLNVCNSINKDGLLDMCCDLIREMMLPADVYVSDDLIALILQPIAAQREDYAVSFYAELKERLRYRYCYIDYYFHWAPDSPMNVDPEIHSWDVSDFTGSSGDSGGEAGDSSPNLPVVDPTALGENPYIDCVYKKVSNKSSTFKAYLKRFMGENSIAHLKFEFSTNVDEGAYGELDYQMDKYWLTIKLNEVLLANATPLMVAKTIMHEVIHANIFAKLMSLKLQLKPDLGTDEMFLLNQALNEQNFPTLYYYYEKYVFDATAQHQYMATYNVDVIAAVLKEIDPTANRDVCLAIAWEGLKSTETVLDGVLVTVATEAWKAVPDIQKKRMAEAYKRYLESATKECND